MFFQPYGSFAQVQGAKDVIHKNPSDTRLRFVFFFFLFSFKYARVRV